MPTSFWRALVALALVPASQAGIAVVETGELGGARYRIDIPEEWNRGLVVYMHGYSPAPNDPDDERQTERLRFFLDEGYALLRSGYSAGGWAVEEAIQETEALRRRFVAEYGEPRETFVTGHSMGGFLTMTMIERFPHIYAAGLPLCGPLGPAAWFMERRVFDFRVVFDAYFPGALPSPARTPTGYRNTAEENARLEALLSAHPEKAAALRQYTALRTDQELARTAAFWTFVLMDLQQRSGGNAFDNRNTLYSGSPDDDWLNAAVERYAAEPGAAEYLRLYYEPHGRITRPMLAIHTTYDPLVPPWVPNRYAELTERAGSGALFVQRYTPRPGHCAIESEEIRAGFRDLREWVETGIAPGGGLQGP
ncbi:MAG: alpha/beta fold hydrolase [Acidobacteria bacterium]|nr:alpha/beta fold hydrolase [Acidobacteriota bacterium]